MSEPVKLDYVIETQADLNLSYMPFIVNGGLFIPTTREFNLGDKIILNLKLPAQTKNMTVEGEIVWITPKNALYHVFQGIGIQFTGDNAESVGNQIKANLDTSLDVGGYTSGIFPQKKKGS